MFGALPAEVYGAGLVFCRVGSLIMLLPGIGEASVPPRIRLSLALVLTLAFYPILRAGIPAVPGTVGGVGAQILIELAIGLAIGSLLRLFLGALVVAGETVSLQTTLSFAQTANPLGGQPTTTVATFLTLLGLTLVFATDLHQMFIAAIINSYGMFPAGRGFSVGDFGQLSIQTMSQTFALGIQLAAPVIVFSLVFNIAVGFIGRAMPQFQIFFVATPLSVLLGLSILALTLGVFGLVWVDKFRTFVGQLV
ncbi:MAG TPA: flagellar biosynthetic protein FliR [Caulobacteraceae bacterium]|jgi:flagellar biosynthetic protein FliR|nr:flagellar biosynthetic protein FliR [Caulobacteraceae bacterium]